jgi:vacuolar-type H+-ATPase subunit E/Vma4
MANYELWIKNIRRSIDRASDNQLEEMREEAELLHRTIKEEQVQRNS